MKLNREVVERNIRSAKQPVYAEQEYQLRVREVVAREEFTKALRGKRSDDVVIDAAIDSLSRVEAAQRRGYAPVDSTPSNPKDGGHEWLVHHNCENQYCNICEGGLAQCTVCGAAECELPSECPGVRMTPEQREAVCAGTLDYKNGQWIKTAPSDSVDWYEEQNQADHRRIAAMEAAHHPADTTEWFGR